MYLYVLTAIVGAAIGCLAWYSRIAVIIPGVIVGILLGYWLYETYSHKALPADPILAAILYHGGMFLSLLINCAIIGEQHPLLVTADTVYERAFFVTIFTLVNSVLMTVPALCGPIIGALIGYTKTAPADRPQISLR